MENSKSSISLLSENLLSCINSQWQGQWGVGMGPCPLWVPGTSGIYLVGMKCLPLCPSPRLPLKTAWRDAWLRTGGTGLRSEVICLYCLWNTVMLAGVFGKEMMEEHHAGERTCVCVCVCVWVCGCIHKHILQMKRYVSVKVSLFEVKLMNFAHSYSYQAQIGTINRTYGFPFFMRLPRKFTTLCHPQYTYLCILLAKVHSKYGAYIWF